MQLCRAFFGNFGKKEYFCRNSKPNQKTMKLFKIFLLCMATFTLLGSATAQERIDVGAELWIEPSQSEAEVENWVKTMADSKMRSARIFLMWN